MQHGLYAAMSCSRVGSFVLVPFVRWRGQDVRYTYHGRAQGAANSYCRKLRVFHEICDLSPSRA